MSLTVWTWLAQNASGSSDVSSRSVSSTMYLPLSRRLTCFPSGVLIVVGPSFSFAPPLPLAGMPIKSSSRGPIGNALRDLGLDDSVDLS